MIGAWRCFSDWLINRMFLLNQPKISENSRSETSSSSSSSLQIHTDPTDNNTDQFRQQLQTSETSTNTHLRPWKLWLLRRRSCGCRWCCCGCSAAASSPARREGRGHVVIHTIKETEHNQSHDEQEMWTKPQETICCFSSTLQAGLQESLAQTQTTTWAAYSLVCPWNVHTSCMRCDQEQGDEHRFRDEQERRESSFFHMERVNQSRDHADDMFDTSVTFLWLWRNQKTFLILQTCWMLNTKSWTKSSTFLKTTRLLGQTCSCTCE